jgi:hypothetical protein
MGGQRWQSGTPAADIYARQYQVITGNPLPQSGGLGDQWNSWINRYSPSSSPDTYGTYNDGMLYQDALGNPSQGLRINRSLFGL